MKQTAKSTLLHIGVRASNLDRSIQFWRDGLGLHVVRQNKNRYDLSDGYHNFAIFQHQGDARPPHVGGMLDYLHVGVGVEDIGATARRLRKMGYQIFSDGLGGKQPIDPNNLQADAFKVEDPDGITVDVNGTDTAWPGTTLHPNAQGMNSK